MIRFLDLCFAIGGLLVASPILILVFLLGLLDTGSPLFLQKRLGKNKQVFTLVKFRTMDVGTRSVATHLSSASSVTKFGRFLRETKLDELPQLWNVLTGAMSMVGPRPGLENQTELTVERDKKGVYGVRPGITGLAQINHIDMSTPELLADWDAKMIKEMSLYMYLSLILKTVTGSGRGDKIRT